MNKEVIKKKFSNILESKRHSLGFSKKDMCDYLDVPYLQLQRWVSCQTLPRSSTLKACCDKLNIDYLTLVSGGLESYSLDSLTVDNAISHYKSSTLIAAKKKAYLACSSVLYQDLLENHGFAVSMFLMPFTNTFTEVTLFDITATITSKDFGKLLILPCKDGICFHHTEPNTQVQTTNLSSLEILSSNSITRIVELLKLKANVDG